MVLLCIGMKYGAERVKQTIKRVILIFSNHIKPLVQMVDSMVVFDFIPNLATRRLIDAIRWVTKPSRHGLW